ncbi:MAG TPA: hypothetical protein VII82_02290 [Polyangiaceae bacterium]
MPAISRILAPDRGAIVALVVACVGCPANLEDPGRFTLDGAAPADGKTGCGDIPQTLFIPTCATPVCHSTSSKQQGLDLQSPDLASRLVSVPSTEGAGLLIDPSMPSASVLYTKLTATPPFGVRMPFNLPALDDATVACVLEWVTSQVGDAGADASDDGDALEPPVDDSSAPSVDAVAPNEASAPVRDASSTQDARPTGPKDAGVQDAGTTPRDAGSPVDAKTD